MHIGGRWTDSFAGETFEGRSPATGEIVAIVSEGGREEARAAIDAAGKAREKIAAMPVYDRASLCRAIADVVESRRDVLARELSLEQGKPIVEARVEVSNAAERFRDAAENIKRLETSVIPSRDPRKRVLTIRQPHGVVAVITPWNIPVGIPSQYLSAGLAAGNAIVWKPAPTTSAIAARLLECLLEAGLPQGVVNLVFGGADVGEELVSSPGTHAVGFTGSSTVGNQVAKAAGAKPLLLELGGNGPVIVLDDANLPAAVQGTAFACYRNAGQICRSAERILVHERVHASFLQGLVEKTRAIKLGHPLDEATTMGPLNNDAVARKMDVHIKDAVEKGAVIMTGGGRAKGFPTSLYYEPTVLDQVSPDSLINQEETFGPVAPLIRISDIDEALEVANSCPLGLVASVYTSSLHHAFCCAERLQCGVVNVNETPAYWDGRTPVGGYSGKGSGVGRIGGMATIEALSQLKSLVLHIENAKSSS